MGLLEYIGGLIGLLLIWMVYSLRGVNWIEYFKTKTGLEILKGIVIALSFSIILGLVSLLTGCTGTYFNEASVYAGIDQSKRPVSPQCISGSVDSRATSNLGFKINAYQSEDKTFKSNLKYTHHSCAFGEDRNTYDAIGGELEYKFWSR